jgi:hypothetical protein
VAELKRVKFEQIYADDIRDVRHLDKSDEIESLTNSILRNGVLSPPILYFNADRNVYEIVDGFMRTSALFQLNYPELSAEVQAEMEKEYAEIEADWEEDMLAGDIPDSAYPDPSDDSDLLDFLGDRHEVEWINSSPAKTDWTALSKKIVPVHPVDIPLPSPHVFLRKYGIGTVEALVISISELGAYGGVTIATLVSNLQKTDLTTEEVGRALLLLQAKGPDLKIRKMALMTGKNKDYIFQHLFFMSNKGLAVRQAHGDKLSYDEVYRISKARKLPITEYPAVHELLDERQGLAVTRREIETKIKFDRDRIECEQSLAPSNESEDSADDNNSDGGLDFTEKAPKAAASESNFADTCKASMSVAVLREMAGLLWCTGTEELCELHVSSKLVIEVQKAMKLTPDAIESIGVTALQKLVTRIEVEKNNALGQ